MLDLLMGRIRIGSKMYEFTRQEAAILVMLQAPRMMAELTHILKCNNKTVSVHLWNIRRKAPVVIKYDGVTKLYHMETVINVKSGDE